ncbi:hypothetical protein GDO81_025235 [Engystomops pustulosus]|uniref:Uncharacterized protein n=1 Tax=Engystomops pustulosus TaxID=76066 RepID=A0AAV6YPW6_ENGPU|nr:hypothetical protein GDO81_025235 [Engystomops pustulosus]
MTSLGIACGKDFGFGKRCALSIVRSFAVAWGSKQAKKSVKKSRKASVFMFSEMPLRRTLFLLERSSMSAILLLRADISSSTELATSTISLWAAVISAILFSIWLVLFPRPTISCLKLEKAV